MHGHSGYYNLTILSNFGKQLIDNKILFDVTYIRL